jgi:EAL domain-containing protein (putative c-di-GMP-specific phosphodiesterase class I)
MRAGDLMRCADLAMYWAKARGKSRVVRYNRAEHGEVVTARVLEEHLPHAVERDEIVVYYQPHVDMHSSRCVGVEALVRWQHPSLGLVAPAEFIPIAERTGQIGLVGAHVLRTACRQMAAWSARWPGFPLRLAVNVAARQLLDRSFTQTVRQALAEAGLAPDRLTLELTESEVIDDQVAVGQLRELAGHGIRISIDDFGTGYTSLASLRAFPVHQIKIDRTFIERPGHARADAMLELVISVGRVLDLETVAEGVETEEQAETLRLAGVGIAQGYRFAHPMTAEQFAGWYAARLARPDISST